MKNAGKNMEAFCLICEGSSGMLASMKEAAIEMGAKVVYQRYAQDAIFQVRIVPVETPSIDSRSKQAEIRSVEKVV